MNLNNLFEALTAIAHFEKFLMEYTAAHAVRLGQTSYWIYYSPVTRLSRFSNLKLSAIERRNEVVWSD